LPTPTDNCFYYILGLYNRVARDWEFSNPAGTGFTGFGQKFRPDLRKTGNGYNWG
jgi:hypothetical protein